MNLVTISPDQLHRSRRQITQFVKKYGEQRITHRAIRWFAQLRSTDLKEGTLITVTLDHKLLTGVAVFGNYGLTESFTVIHPQYRKMRLGEKLLNHSLNQLGKVYTRVACDNIPSIKLCFSCNLIAIGMTKGPTKKPTLIFGGGNWNKEDLNLFAAQIT